MRALLDVNVLVAMFDASHSLHQRAMAWLSDNASHGWSSCPITQNGCVRVLANAAYPQPLPVSAVAQRLREATAHSVHEFWPDDLSLLDSNAVDCTRIHSHRQLTDVYLLALAVKRRGRLITFDQGISLGAVRGAAAGNLLQI